MLLSVVHNALQTGLPGAGRTLFARSLPGISSRMSVDEVLEGTRINTVSSLVAADKPLILSRAYYTLHDVIRHGAG